MRAYALNFTNEDDAFLKKRLKAKTDGELRMKLQRIADQLVRLDRAKQGIRV